MDADLDLLLRTAFVTADDLLPERTKNAARWVTDAEVVTLCLAQTIMGIPFRSAVSRGRGQTAGASVCRTARAAWVLQAPPPTGGQVGVADGRVREPEPRLPRGSAADRLHPGAVRPIARDGQPLGHQPAARRARKRVRLAFPVLLGNAAAPDLRSGWHPARLGAGLPEDRRTRGGPDPAGPLPPARRRDADRREGIRRPRARRTGQHRGVTLIRAVRHDETTPHAGPG